MKSCHYYIDSNQTIRTSCGHEHEQGFYYDQFCTHCGQSIDIVIKKPNALIVEDFMHSFLSEVIKHD